MLRNSYGVTLVEMLIVITVMGVLSAFTVISYRTIINNVEKDLNDILIMQIEQDYARFLLVDQLEHSDELFFTFMNENYQDYINDLSYEEGHIVHKEIEPKKEEEVPFLSRHVWIIRAT